MTPAPPPNPFDRLARRAVLNRMSQIRHGRLTLTDGPTARVFGTDDPSVEPPPAAVEIRHPRFWRRLLTGGTIGAAESWLDREWDTPDLVAVIRLLARNRVALETLETGTARLTAPLFRLGHWLNRNTRRGSHRNIAAHYDLSNAFFRLFLDPSLTYSAAIFDPPHLSLADAQTVKLDRVCRKLDLRPSDHLLEIGTGWGSLALHAAGRYGCRVTTTTISAEQHRLAAERVAAAGLADRVTLLQQDYRDLTGRFDKVVSVEMIEAVGHRFYDAYFGTICRVLKPDGAALIQAITIDDRVYDRAIRRVDFIQHFIFPGSCIPSLAAIAQSVKRATDMRLVHLEDITAHYVRTLAAWRRAFRERETEVRALGFPNRFIRLWDFYLAYCEGGFAERAIGDVQLLLARPLFRREPGWTPPPPEVTP